MKDPISELDGEVDIKVFNAGSILLWPFLIRFFKHLSLLKNSDFIDDKAKQKAVYLLQYLVHNNIDFPEHQLVLNKVLVEMSSLEVLDLFINVSEEDKELAQSLIISK